MIETKRFYHSKTLWFNALTIAAIAVDAITSAGAISNPDVLPWVAVAAAVINAGLRMVTSMPVIVAKPLAK